MPDKPHPTWSLYVRRVTPQLTVLSALTALAIAGKTGIIPTINELASVTAQYLLNAPLQVVALFSFIENLPLVSAYFPGSLVILVRMAGTSGDPAGAFITYLAIAIPAVAANLISFELGRVIGTASFVRSPKRNRVRSQAMLYASTYWHPQLAAMTAFLSGSRGLRRNLHLKLLLSIGVPWTAVWATLLYVLGVGLPVREDLTLLTLVYVVIWLAADTLRHLRSPRPEGPSDAN